MEAFTRLDAKVAPLPLANTYPPESTLAGACASSVFSASEFSGT